MLWNIPLIISCELTCLCPLSAFCPLPAYSSYSLWGEGEESLDTVQALFQQQPKPWCIIRTALATNPKHSIILTAVNQVHSSQTQYSFHPSLQIICIIPSRLMCWHQPLCAASWFVSIAIPTGPWSHYGSRALATLLEVQQDVPHFCKFAWPSFSLGSFDNLSC